jgi:YesN/AraC family two-component response regulator
MVSDIMMPEMNGFELSQAARQYNPALNIQLVSGFADDSLIKDPLSEQLYQLRLQKPVRASQLIKRVKELLSSGAEPAV